MSQNSKIAIVVLATLLIGVVIYFLSDGESTFETDSWYESYSPEDKGPYGTYVFKELLDTTGIFESFIQIDGRIEDQLIDTEDENDIYFFIGRENYMSEASFEELIYFVAKGNTAFISAQNMPEHMLDFFFLKMNRVYDYTRDTSQSYTLFNSEFSHKQYLFKFINNNFITPKNWVYFKPNNVVYQTAGAKTLGANNKNQTNFIEVPYEDGSFFFHSNPYLFSNIAMFRFDGFPYSEDLIHHLPYGKIQWDIYNLYAHSVYNTEDTVGSDRRSIFQFIFQHKALTWAFVILLVTAILYALFKGKRKQKIIVATELKENSSLSYIETVSSLYLQERKHSKLIKLQEQSFVEFIANHYYIRHHKIDDFYIKSISSKSDISETKIKDIFMSFESLSSQSKVSDIELIGLQQKIEYFYKNCK